MEGLMWREVDPNGFLVNAFAEAGLSPVTLTAAVQ